MNPLLEAMKAKEKPAPFDETKMLELFREWHQAMHQEMTQGAEPKVLKVETQESHA